MASGTPHGSQWPQYGNGVTADAWPVRTIARGDILLPRVAECRCAELCGRRAPWPTAPCLAGADRDLPTGGHAARAAPPRLAWSRTGYQRLVLYRLPDSRRHRGGHPGRQLLRFRRPRVGARFVLALEPVRPRLRASHVGASHVGASHVGASHVGAGPRWSGARWSRATLEYRTDLQSKQRISALSVVSRPETSPCSYCPDYRPIRRLARGPRWPVGPRARDLRWSAGSRFALPGWPAGRWPAGLPVRRSAGPRSTLVGGPQSAVPMNDAVSTVADSPGTVCFRHSLAKGDRGHRSVRAPARPISASTRCTPGRPSRRTRGRLSKVDPPTPA
jgi:hypothetical protein